MSNHSDELKEVADELDEFVRGAINGKRLLLTKEREQLAEIAERLKRLASDDDD